MLKTEYIDVLSVISHKLYDSAANVMNTASKLIPANTFCIANLDHLSTKVLKSFNRDKLILEEGLVVDNAESYCALVTEHAQGPLIIDNNLTHPLTKDMDATRFVGGCSFIGVPIRNEKGEFYGSLCSFDHGFYRYQERDVDLLLSLSSFYTDLLELESTIDRLQMAEQAAVQVLDNKKNLLAVLSHEIRTPMNGVLGMADLLKSTELNEEQALYVNVIEESGNHLLNMMDQILEYSKMEAGMITVENHPFQLSEVVEHVIQLFTPEAQKKGIRLYAEYHVSQDFTLHGDIQKTRQILINLLGNAIKFTEQGEVGISVQLEDAAENTMNVCFEVRDTGVGIPADRIDLLFKSFSQIHSNPNKFRGAGLGLSICKHLAELMSGTVWLEETSERGSRFIFKFCSCTAS